MKKDKLFQLRFNILNNMNEYVKNIEDENAYYRYWSYIVPDGCKKDDLEEIAEDTELFDDICQCFAKIIKRYERG